MTATLKLPSMKVRPACFVSTSVLAWKESLSGRNMYLDTLCCSELDVATCGDPKSFLKFGVYTVFCAPQLTSGCLMAKHCS
ncbi:hypothetical protein A0H81_08278 [Grifola frondosa]|uniref:Uncharacterized protein n=1 Tax=Grifola frondosa TaxID=5627 RepID=A0A1C7M5W0_GRIFR|nr:hypothetical protein A0H81_08278 [Grifola frondosa]